MATTTATFSLSSADIAPSPVNVSSTTTLYKAGLSTGLDQTTGMSRRILKTSETGKTLLISPALYGTQVLHGVTLANADATVELASASPTLAELGIKVGDYLEGTGVPAGATVLSITDADTFEMSVAADQDVVTTDGSIAVFAKATASKANKVYICNSSTSSEDYFVVTINQEEIGRLYGGDWMFMPWSASDDDAEIYVTAAVHTTPVIIDYMVVGEGNAA
tara:strand:- start:5505 stop:6167 length:663 start_codon:yes stop_codon:yes gene_type:complete